MRSALGWMLWCKWFGHPANGRIYYQHILGSIGEDGVKCGRCGRRLADGE